MRYYVSCGFLVLIVLITLSTASRGATIHVPLDYPLIQDAINAAQSGDTIQVAAGTYYENLIITKSILLLGEDRRNTILNGSNAGNVILGLHDNITLKGFTIQNSSYGWPYSGLLLDGCNIHEISENKFSDNYIGLHLSDSSNNTISDNIFTDNSHWGMGIYAYAAPSTNNHVFGNLFDHSHVPIMIDHATHISVSDNQFIETSDIYMFDVTDSSITGNLLTGLGSGIAINDSDIIDISSNELRDSIQGIQCNSSCSGFTICNNILDGILTTAIELHGSDHSVSQNKIEKAAFFGIGVSGNDNEIYGNALISCCGEGVALEYGASNNILYHNDFVGNCINAGDFSGNFTNTWDNGYPSGGNFWDDYGGADLNGDGIGDRPYEIGPGIGDKFPLMNPLTPLPSHVMNLDTAEMFFSIQSAINDSNTLAGHTIYVPSGTYEETLLLDKSLHLQGEDKRSTFIEAIKHQGIEVAASGCTIDGFTLCPYKYSQVDDGLLLEADNTTVTSCILMDFEDAGIFVNSNHNIIADNEILDCRYGIWIYKYNYNNTISGNVITNASNILIWLHDSSSNMIIDNQLSGSGYHGIYAQDSNLNHISHNSFENISHCGIKLNEKNSDNALFGNSFKEIGDLGIYLHSTSHRNSIWKNTFHESPGIALDVDGNDNQIYYNSFLSSTGSLLDIDTSTSGNMTTAPYPMGGNYYSNYYGQDNYSGPNQDQPGSDGIGDTPHLPGSMNEDPYPLMNLYQGLYTDKHILSSSTGGVVQFTLDAGSYHGNKHYAILGSVTGVLPGTPVPGYMLTLPINWDSFTNLMIPYLNSAVFQNFMGVLDANGSAAALLKTRPIGPDLVGVTFHFSYALYQSWDVVSNPVALTIVP